MSHVIFLHLLISLIGDKDNSRYNHHMKSCAFRFLHFIVLDILVVMALSYLLVSSPQPVSGPVKYGYQFTVMGFKEKKPVELFHEWSIRYIDSIIDSNTEEGLIRSEIKAAVEEQVKLPIIWADTGKAIRPYRYYLTKTDLQNINTTRHLGSGAGSHSIRVKMLKNDPQNKRQTLRVVVNGDLNRFINIYQVENDRVKPLKWLRYRPFAATVVAVVISLPVTCILFVLSSWVYGRFVHRPKPT